VNSRDDFGHDRSTINVVVVIIAITIIVSSSDQGRGTDRLTVVTPSWPAGMVMTSCWLGL